MEARGLWECVSKVDGLAQRGVWGRLAGFWLGAAAKHRDAPWRVSPLNISLPPALFLLLIKEN
jgi:hypothetical protein